MNHWESKSENNKASGMLGEAFLEMMQKHTNPVMTDDRQRWQTEYRKVSYNMNRCYKVNKKDVILMSKISCDNLDHFVLN